MLCIDYYQSMIYIPIRMQPTIVREHAGKWLVRFIIPTQTQGALSPIVAHQRQHIDYSDEYNSRTTILWPIERKNFSHYPTHKHV
jgi:hypothetical protein